MEIDCWVAGILEASIHCDLIYINFTEDDADRGLCCEYNQVRQSPWKSEACTKTVTHFAPTNSLKCTGLPFTKYLAFQYIWIRSAFILRYLYTCCKCQSSSSITLADSCSRIEVVLLYSTKQEDGAVLSLQIELAPFPTECWASLSDWIAILFSLINSSIHQWFWRGSSGLVKVG